MPHHGPRLVRAALALRDRHRAEALADHLQRAAGLANNALWRGVAHQADGLLTGDPARCARRYGCSGPPPPGRPWPTRCTTWRGRPGCRRPRRSTCWPRPTRCTPGWVPAERGSTTARRATRPAVRPRPR
ncbi:hypothetical protein V2I01_06920 [Micromonospora sp. BRA006-A]|nr:hypothetical protein [Micromonospora sp. BRA006-A]